MIPDREWGASQGGMDALVNPDLSNDPAEPCADRMLGQQFLASRLPSGSRPRKGRRRSWERKKNEGPNGSLQ